jgi:uncharacterized protein
MGAAWPPTLGTAAIAVVGGATAVVVGADGTVGWQIARVTVTLGLTVWAFVRRPGFAPAPGSFTDSAFGVVGTALGLGIGIPWLADGNTTAVSVASIVALVAGVILLMGAGVATVTANHGWWRALLLPWIVVVGLGIFVLAVATAATNVSPTPTFDARPRSVGLVTQPVEMEASDGTILRGWYVPSSNGAAVVVRHGAGSNRASTLDHAAVLAANGYGVLMVDARGHGESDGRAMDFGWYGELDTQAAIDFLQRRPDVGFNRFAVLGLSMGGEEAIGAAGADPRIGAVVAEGATGRTADDRRWLSDEFGLRGLAQEQIDRVTYGLVDLFTSRRPPASLEQSIVLAAPTPVLLIAAGDVDSERIVSERLRAASPTSVQVWVVDDAGHVGGLATAPAAWEERVVSFLDDALGVERSTLDDSEE